MEAVSGKSLELFISYADEDEPLYHQLQIRLTPYIRSGRIVI
jgi:hypothetical protein